MKAGVLNDYMAPSFDSVGLRWSEDWDTSPQSVRLNCVWQLSARYCLYAPNALFPYEVHGMWTFFVKTEDETGISALIHSCISLAHYQRLWSLSSSPPQAKPDRGCSSPNLKTANDSTAFPYKVDQFTQFVRLFYIDEYSKSLENKSIKWITECTAEVSPQTAM